MDPEMRQLQMRLDNIRSTLSYPIRGLYEYLIGELRWDSNYTSNLFIYLRKSIISILSSNNYSLYRNSESVKKHTILDNMMSDVLERIIINPSILRYSAMDKKFDDTDMKNIIRSIAEDANERQDPESAEDATVRQDPESAEDATERPDPESATDYLRAHKLNKAKQGELAGNYNVKHAGKRSKNNKKKSKRKHRHNKKSHKKRR